MHHGNRRDHSLGLWVNQTLMCWKSINPEASADFSKFEQELGLASDSSSEIITSKYCDSPMDFEYE